MGEAVPLAPRSDRMNGNTRERDLLACGEWNSRPGTGWETESSGPGAVVLMRLQSRRFRAEVGKTAVWRG